MTLFGNGVKPRDNCLSLLVSLSVISSSPDPVDAEAGVRPSWRLSQSPWRGWTTSPVSTRLTTGVSALSLTCGAHGSAQDIRRRKGDVKAGESEGETDRERLWTPGNKRRVSEGRGWGRVGAGVGIQEGTDRTEPWVLYANSESQ